MSYTHIFWIGPILGKVIHGGAGVRNILPHQGPISLKGRISRQHPTTKSGQGGVDIVCHARTGLSRRRAQINDTVGPLLNGAHLPQGRANNHGEQNDYRRKTKIHTMTNFKIFHNSAPLKDLHQSIKKTQKK
jgi:hypothetical protein